MQTTSIRVGLLLLLALGPVMATGLRVTEEDEIEGLDITLHDEHGYNI